MKLPAPLLPGRLLRRYQRFFVDVELDDGRIVIAHTPNTGRMLQCALPGHRVLLSASSNPLRRLAWNLELIEVNSAWVDTQTQRSNRIVEEGLRSGAIVELSGYEVLPEVSCGQSRLDFLLKKGEERVWVEVKNVTYCAAPTLAAFPDAVTTRGQKHLRELLRLRQEGERAFIFFLVQRPEATAFTPADAIDPVYGELLRTALSRGVEALAYSTVVTPAAALIGRRLPLLL